MRQDLIEQKRRRTAAACCVLLVKVRGYGKDGGTMEGDEDEGGEGLAGMVYRRRRNHSSETSHQFKPPPRSDSANERRAASLRQP